VVAEDTTVIVVEMVMVVDVRRGGGCNGGEDDKEGGEGGAECPWTREVGGGFPLEGDAFLGDELHLLEETRLAEEDLLSGEFLFFFCEWRVFLLVLLVVMITTIWEAVGSEHLNLVIERGGLVGREGRERVKGSCKV
jgi:hypothetical protein